MPISIRVAIKPTSSIGKKQKTVDLSRMKDTIIEVKGRHDPCIVPKAVPVVESSTALILADHMLRAGAIPKVLAEE
jgi:chorismate synthase